MRKKKPSPITVEPHHSRNDATPALCWHCDAALDDAKGAVPFPKTVHQMHRINIPHTHSEDTEAILCTRCLRELGEAIAETLGKSVLGKQSENLQMIEYRVQYQPYNYSQDYVLLFDKRDVTVEQAERYIRSCAPDEMPVDMVAMPLEKFKKVFRSLTPNILKEELHDET